MDKILKLHLGCNNRKIYGYINIDVREEVKPDLIDDIYTLNSFEIGSVDIVYASHVLEHVGRWEVISVLKRWYELLKVGGVLRLSVPDFEKIVQYYLITHDLEKLHGLLHARQANPYDIHYISFDYKFLSNCLIDAGFSKSKIKLYDWTDTEHSHIDDGSQSYLPHLDKVNGILMSLNVEATK